MFLRLWMLPVCIAAFFTLLHAPCSYGQLLPFLDDFNDGDATDGMPGTWLPGSQPGGTRDATSGDMVVSHTAQMSTLVQELTGLQDLSIGTQLSFTELSGNADALVVWARSPANSPAAYSGGIANDGLLAIVYTDDNLAVEFLAATPSSLDPVGADVLLQFDVFGTQLSLTAWQAGDAKPAGPQLTVTDSRLTEGGQLGFTFSPNFGGGDAPASAVLRHYSVVPEPSTALLAIIGLCGIVGVARRR